MKKYMRREGGAVPPVLYCICVLSFFGGVGSVGYLEKQENCEAVNNRCVSRVSCGMALKNFMLLCNDLLFGETTECSPHCTRALTALLSPDAHAGVGYTDCDCGADAACQLKKQRVELCSQPVLDVIRSLDDSTPVECNMAVWLCEADTGCQRALLYYWNHCKALIEGASVCSERCNNSLALLHRHTKGTKLVNCACAGSENCTRLQRNMDRLCIHNNRLQNGNSPVALSAFLYITALYVLIMFNENN